MKDKDASLEQWRLLVTLTQRLIAMEPWKQFEDMEIFALKFSNTSDLVYSSIMGFHKMCYGLTFYKGEEGFTDISTVAYEVNDKRFENYVTMDTSFLSVYFDDQENVSFMQKEIFKKLGLEEAAYPHFTVKEKGCFPDDPDCQEVDTYILYLASLIEAIEYFLKNEVIINFENEMFVYDVSSKTGTNMKFELKPREFMAVLPNDTQFLDSLKDIDCNNESWEFEYNYINQGMEREDGRIVNVRFVMAACLNDGSMICCVPLEEDSDEVQVVLEALFSSIERRGRPLSICINNARIFPLLGPSCDYLGIALDEVDELEVIDDFLEGFYDYAKTENMA